MKKRRISQNIDFSDQNRIVKRPNILKESVVKDSKKHIKPFQNFKKFMKNSNQLKNILDQNINNSFLEFNPFERKGVKS